MAAFLDWFASHNTLVIQSLAAIVAMLIVALIFRLLFANQEATAESAVKNVTYAQLEEKLNKLLEQQSHMKVSVAAVTTSPEETLSVDALAALAGDSADAANVAVATTPSEQLAELNRLKAEITSLKDSLNKKEAEINSAKEQAAQSANTPQQGADLANLNGKITDYEQEIEALKNRLSDYEIIAEDIADLQRYKKENQDLKNQLANQPQAVVTEGPVDTEAFPELTSDPEPEEVQSQAVQATQEEVAPSVEPEAAVAVVEEEVEVKLDPNVMPDPVVAAKVALDTPEALEVSKDVKKEDKKLLDEFEKHFAKEDD